MGMQDDTARSDQQVEDRVEEHQGVVTDIYDVSDTCFDILERLVSVGNMDSPIQQEPFISDINLPCGSPRDIRGIRNSFAFWADYTGALAPIGASLDDRLQGHEEINEMIVELLEMLERNLYRLEKNYDRNSIFPNEESQEILSAIDSALDRLNCLARAIRKASIEGRQQDLLTFTNDEDRLFRQMAVSYIKWKCPKARSSLREHMGASITTQRRFLMQKYQLKVGRERKHRPWYPQEAVGPLLSSIKISDPRMPAVEATKATQASGMGEGMALQTIPHELTLSTSTSGFVQKEDSVSVEYPDPPQIELDHDQCPYCLELLPVAVLLRADKDEYWKQWPRKVHAMIWYCDLDHEEKFKFDNEADWKTHMQTLSLHPGHSKPPTEAQLDALVVRKQKLALRDPYICPFCEYIPQSIATPRDRGNLTDMEKRLINHIASHIKSFLLMALPSVNVESVEGDKRAASQGSSLYQRRRMSVPDVIMDVDEAGTFPTNTPTIQPFLSWDFTLPRGWLWDTAYDDLKIEMPNLIGTYEDLLSRVLIGEDSHVSNHFSQIDVVVRREKMKQIADFVLEHTDEKASKTVLGHEIAPQEVVKDTNGLIKTAKVYIGDSIRDLPYTCIISAGVALVIPLLVKPIATEAANQSGLIYIATQMRYYASMESLLLSDDLSDDTKIDLMERLANLYKSIISFQVRSVIRFYRSRTKSSFIETDSYSDWDKKLQDIKDSDAAIISIVEGVIPRSNPRSIRELLKTLRGLVQEAEGSREALEGQLRTAQDSDEHLRTTINQFQQFLSDTPIDDLIQRPLILGLEMPSYDRFQRTQATNNVEAAIQPFQDPINIRQRDHLEQTASLIKFANEFDDRYFRTGNINDLERAIRITRYAVDMTQHDYSSQRIWLNYLGSRLTARYLRTGAVSNLEEAIQMTRTATRITPYDDPNRAALLYALGTQMGYRYSLTGAMDDLDKAIDNAQDAINLTPTDHPNRTVLLGRLGTQLGHRYSLTGKTDDLENARKCLAGVLFSSAMGTSVRIAAGCQLLLAPGILTDPRASTVASTIISLLPLLTPRSMKNLHKQDNLSKSSGIPSEATAIALHNNGGPLVAIHFLETGYGLVWGSIFQQHEISNLAKIHPELASSFIDLLDRLDAPTLPGSDLLTGRSSTARQVESDQRREAIQQVALLLDRIRSIRGFGRFLLPPSESEMLRAARCGPIVVLNASRHRCDALIVQQSGFRSLHLPRVSEGAIDHYRQNLESIETLSWLWDDVVSPILDVLGFTHGLSDHQLPRVWWVPMGKLTKFPLHAAGRHFGGRNETTLDRVVSSYASSINLIVHSRRKQHKMPVNWEPTSLVAVAMAETEGQSELLNAQKEIDTVSAVLGSKITHHGRPPPFYPDILLALRGCDIFHFVGHSRVDFTEPLRSLLLLRDWETEPLTMERLLDADFDANAFLAYLSTCNVGEPGYEKLYDEDIHLATGFRLAGFRHVIGIRGVVDDAICVDMAQKTYEFLRDEGLRDESVSRGLHHAMRALRDEWVHTIRDAQNTELREMEVQGDIRADKDAEMGTKEFILEGTVPRPPPPPRWISFFHCGS
ncbi:tpr domain-containing [Trichoderma arundinaceum]|uniref:Tpr domain-containing n=1 Tax=Trichoderma arundinaceum TaxID=490622 RepID=A0A395NIY3_TRIAR|nr:tpr domain-containing [Trichoderma arundinaceum]